jgi:hypothetical protein
MMMQLLDSFCRYETFGAKITKNGVTVKMICGFKVEGVGFLIKIQNRGLPCNLQRSQGPQCKLWD